MLTYTCLYMHRNFVTNTQETIAIGFSLGRITGDLGWKENFDFIYVFKIYEEILYFINKILFKKHCFPKIRTEYLSYTSSGQEERAC